MRRLTQFTRLTSFTVLALASATLTTAAIAKSGAQWQQLAAQSKLSLVQAIESATRTVPGTVIDAELDQGDAAGARYELEVITPNGDSVEVWVNAVTGQAAQHKNEGKAKRKDLQRLEDAKATLPQAIQSATTHTPGTAVAAELDSHWGTTSYQVDVLQADGVLMEVKVDAADGRVIRAKRD